jgi:hypothetical protein
MCRIEQTARLLVSVLVVVVVTGYSARLRAQPSPTDKQSKDETGIELVAGPAHPEPLEQWSVYDAKTNEEVASTRNKWGFAPLAPGEYVVAIEPRTLGVREVRWKQVTVKAGKVTTVKIDSGIELVGSDKDSPPPEYWYVYDAKDADNYPGPTHTKPL